MTCLRSGDPAGSLTDYYPSWLDIRFQWGQAHKLNWPRSLMLVLESPFRLLQSSRIDVGTWPGTTSCETERIKRLESEGGRQSLNKISQILGHPNMLGAGRWIRPSRVTHSCGSRGCMVGSRRTGRSTRNKIGNSDTADPR